MTGPTNDHADTSVTRPGAGLDDALEGLLAAIDTVNAALPYLEEQPEGEPVPAREEHWNGIRR